MSTTRGPTPNQITCRPSLPTVSGWNTAPVSHSKTLLCNVFYSTLAVSPPWCNGFNQLNTNKYKRLTLNICVSIIHNGTMDITVMVHRLYCVLSKLHFDISNKQESSHSLFFYSVCLTLAALLLGSNFKLCKSCPLAVGGCGGQA